MVAAAAGCTTTPPPVRTTLALEEAEAPAAREAEAGLLLLPEAHMLLEALGELLPLGLLLAEELPAEALRLALADLL
jgi:hypothetical protein